MNTEMGAQPDVRDASALEHQRERERERGILGRRDASIELVLYRIGRKDIAPFPSSE